MESASVSLRTVSSAAPFRFLDLPIEIRNKVYSILLTPATTTKTDSEGRKSHKLSLDLETRLLRVSRQIRSEGEYVLRANLFVKFTTKVLIEEFHGIVQSETIALAILKSKQAQSFNAHVLSHDITLPEPLQEPTRVFIILFRDLKDLCAAIQRGQSTLTQHKELIQNIVTIRNPFPNLPSHKGRFLSNDFQGKVLSPYRSSFRDLPSIKFKGFSKDLRLATEREILRPVPTNLETFLREIEHLKAEGNLYFTRGDLYFRDGTGGASSYWDLALQKIDLVLLSPSPKHVSIRQQGGQDFLDRLTALSFSLNSNKAQDYLKCMRYHSGNQELMDEFGMKLSDAVWEAMCTVSKYPGSTWRPTSAQMAKLAYRKAVRCRIGGEPLMLSQAEAAIQQAASLLPDDVAIRTEAGLIARWGCQVRG